LYSPIGIGKTVSPIYCHSYLNSHKIKLLQETHTQHEKENLENT
jgi:hypothetical protein